MKRHSLRVAVLAWCVIWANAAIRAAEWTIDTSSGDEVISTNITTTLNIVKNGSNTLFLRGANSMARLTVNGGGVVLENASKFTSYVNTYNDSTLAATNQTLIFSYNLNNQGGVMAFKNCTITNNDNIGAIVDPSSSYRKLTTIDGGSVWLTQNGGIMAGQNAVATPGKTGEIEIRGGASVDAGYLLAAYGGVITIDDSQIKTKNAAGVRAGRFGSGAIMMNSGTISNSGRVWIGGDDGNNVGHGQYWHTGGTNTAGVVWYLGYSPDSTGKAYVTGGKISQNNSGDFRVGRAGLGFLEVGGDGLVDCYNSSINIGEIAATGSGCVSLRSGGTLVAKSVKKGNGTAAEFIFNGGTLKAASSPSATFVSNLTSFNMGEAGGTVDSNGGSISFNKPLESKSNGLLHRWSFNGDLKDSVTGNEAIATKTTYSENGEIVMSGNSTNSRQSYVDLGPGLLPADGSAFTVEIWATPDELYDWEPMFFAGCATNHVGLFWKAGASVGKVRASHGSGSDDKDLLSYAVGTVYHVALVCEQVDGNWSITTYSQDATGKTLAKAALAVTKGWAPDAGDQLNFYLGGVHSNANRSNNARFNEVRIWKKALAEEDLKMNALLGPDEILSDGAFVKTGAGTLTLTGANTYANDTVVSEGTLALASGATLKAGNRVVVEPGATLQFAGQALASGVVALNASADGVGQFVNTSGSFDLTGLSLEIDGLAALSGGSRTIAASSGGFSGEFASVKLSSGRWMVKYVGNEVKLSPRGFVLVIK